jgi:glutamate 5-kinase
MTLVVKLGSSIVAVDDGALREDVLDSVCAQVAELEQGGERVAMVTSGAIARGMRLMELPVRPRAMDELQAASAVGQGDLFRAYQSRLAEGGTRSAQVLLTAADIAARTNYLNARQTLRRLIDWGVVPVVNENDTTATDEITFGDNDFLAAQVAILLDARLLVLLSDVDGLHRADPRADPDAELISTVEDFGVLAEMDIGDRTSAFGSGGMRSKVAAAEMAAESGIPATICNGTEPGTLLAAAGGGTVGTRFAAQAGKASSFKLWLKYAKPGGTRPAAERLQPSTGRDHEPRRRIQGGRRGRGDRWREGGRQGHSRLRVPRAFEGSWTEDRAGARASSPRGGRGHTPRSVCVDLSAGCPSQNARREPRLSVLGRTPALMATLSGHGGHDHLCRRDLCCGSARGA